MKRLVSLLLSVIILLTCCVFSTNAANEEDFTPYVIDFSLTSPIYETTSESTENRASGLIISYALSLSVTGTTLKISGNTYCIADVVKSGFKNLVIQRKKTTDSTWSDYYDYGDVYSSSYSATLSTTLAVASGYQYRISCEHYGKKNLLSVQKISHTSNIVIV